MDLLVLGIYIMIKWVKRLLFISLFIIAVVIGATFADENKQPISLVLFGRELPEFQFGFWVLSALSLGAVIGWLLSCLPSFWSKKSISAKNREIQQLKEEINLLRTAGIKG